MLASAARPAMKAPEPACPDGVPNGSRRGTLGKDLVFRMEKRVSADSVSPTSDFEDWRNRTVLVARARATPTR